jgi:hypothetical protein
VFYGT